jgi:hypothetical protein
MSVDFTVSHAERLVLMAKGVLCRSAIFRRS